jgi:hypothetical protein
MSSSNINQNERKIIQLGKPSEMTAGFCVVISLIIWFMRSSATMCIFMPIINCLNIAHHVAVSLSINFCEV